MASSFEGQDTSQEQQNATAQEKQPEQQAAQTEQAAPQQEQTQPQQQEQQQESPQDINWKRFREQRKKEREELEKERKRREEQEAQAKALQKALEEYANKSQKQQQPQRSSGWVSDEDEDKRIERKLQEWEEKRRKEREEEEKRQLPQYLRQAHTDFDQVVNQDNIDYLEYHYPEVVKAFYHMPDSYEKWDSLYKSIKRFLPSGREKQINQEKAQQNLNKPQSPNVEGMTQTPDTVPQYLDEERRKNNWERMRRIMKGA